MFNKKSIVKSDIVENKTFNFSKGINKETEIRLGFTLRVDVKQELSTFLELLKEAQIVVEKEIKNRFK